MLDFGCRYRLTSSFFFFNKKSVSRAFVCLINIVRIAVDHYFDTVMMEFIVTVIVTGQTQAKLTSNC